MAKALKREDKIIWAIPNPSIIYGFLLLAKQRLSRSFRTGKEDVETWTMKAGAAKDQLYAFLFFRKNEYHLIY